MFSYRMLGIHGESKYADIMELVLYNSGLSGISLKGTEYYYANPLRRITSYNVCYTKLLRVLLNLNGHNHLVVRFRNYQFARNPSKVCVLKLKGPGNVHT